MSNSLITRSDLSWTESTSTIMYISTLLGWPIAVNRRQRSASRKWNIHKDLWNKQWARTAIDRRWRSARQRTARSIFLNLHAYFGYSIWKSKKKSTEFRVHISQFYNTQAKALDAINKYTKFHYRAPSSF